MKERILIDRAWYPDWEFIRELRNSQKQGFIDQHEITMQEHQDFMLKHQENYFVADLVQGIQGKRAGFVGVVDNDIRFAVHPDYQKRGIGTEMLKFIKIKFPDAIGKVKLENPQSAGAFSKAGFILEKVDTQFYWFIANERKQQSL